MKKTKIKNKDLQEIGLYEEELLKRASKIGNRLINQKIKSKEAILAYLERIVIRPAEFFEDVEFGFLAQKIKELQAQNTIKKEENKVFRLKKGIPIYSIFGEEKIDKGAIAQMNTAMRLPITKAGALMPDAHIGYGLPIGGVLATEADKVIPFAVGVDIACRMCMSVFELEENYLNKNQNRLKNYLQQNTCFGTGKGFPTPMQDDLFDKKDWSATKTIRNLKSKAIAQIGSSGTGNHFVEWGILELLDDENEVGLLAGNYLALLSHSGSRGFGAGIAGHYTKIAIEKTKLTKEAQHLAWLDLNTEEGQEYWIGMNLAGEYASANHHHIHKRMANSLGLKPVKMIENHHNFAWKETLANGTEVIVHRKGATPAHENDLGIIPGSMTAPGFLVKGKGKEDAIFSASHGAGRQFSRNQAKKTFSDEDMKRVLVENGVKLIGGDLDEIPMAYKNIEEVMKFQSDLITIVGKFSPKIVRMADKDKRRPKRSSKKGNLNFQET